jgi:hypothetical protein
MKRQILFLGCLQAMAFGAVLLAGIAAGAQATGQSKPSANSPNSTSDQPATATPSSTSDKQPDSPTSESSNAKVDPRQARISADTQKLVKLSQELKTEVDKSNKDTLSLAVIKKAEEVEKLAKSLKEEISKNP